MKKNGVVALKADYSNGSPEIKEVLNRYGANAIPFYLVFPGDAPDAPIILHGVITKGDVLSALNQAGPSKAVAAAAGTSVREASLREHRE